MRRRLIMVALAISTMVAVAFNVPLAVYIRQYQRDIARVTAQHRIADLYLRRIVAKVHGGLCLCIGELTASG